MPINLTSGISRLIKRRLGPLFRSPTHPQFTSALDLICEYRRMIFTISQVVFTRLLLPRPILAHANCGPSVNEPTIELIQEFEGFVARPLPEPIGISTVGYGHVCKKKGCSEAKPPLTIDSAKSLLHSNLKSMRQSPNCRGSADSP
jgi:Phage lysozyme